MAACSCCMRCGLIGASAAFTAGILPSETAKAIRSRGIGGLKRHPAEQPLEIKHARERFAQLLAGDGLLYLLFHRVQPPINFALIETRPQHPGPQQALAHGGDGGIERAEERHSGISSGEQGLNQFEVPHRDRIEHQAFCRS